MANGISCITSESIFKLLNVLETKNFEIINNAFNNVLNTFFNINFDNDNEKHKFAQHLSPLIEWWDCLSVKICCDDSYFITNEDINRGRKMLHDIKKYISISSWQVSVEEKDDEDKSTGGVITDMIVYTLPMLEKNSNNDDFCSLMKNLMNRQIEVFKPNFEIHEGDSDDNESDKNEPKCEEESETRKEQHGSKTTEEEITKTPDGREIRSTKTRIVNSSRTSKNVTVRRYGNGLDDIRTNFFDVNRSHNEDSDEEFFETFKKPSSYGSSSFGSSNNSSFFKNRKSLGFKDFDTNDFLPTDTLSNVNDNNSNPDDSHNHNNNEESQSNEMQKIKKVDHSSATLQVVEKTKKKNGKLKFNAAAHKLDTKQLTAQQKETYDGDELIRREGDGDFEENTTIGAGDVNPEALMNLGTVNRFGLHDKKEFECGNYDNNGSYIKGLTMTSYLLVNDSISNHEEQFRKKLQFEFRNNCPLKIDNIKSTDKEINLHQLLELADFDEMGKEATEKVNKLSKSKDTVDNILSLTEDLSIFEELNVKPFLTFVIKIDDKGEVAEICRGGPKDALIVFATQNEAPLLFKEAFLSTYRGFVSTLEVILHLIYRFQYLLDKNDSQQNRNAHSTISVIIRIIQDLSVSEMNEKIILTLTQLYNTLYTNSEIQFLRILRKIIFTKIVSFYNSKNDNILPRQVKCMLDGQKVKYFLNMRSLKLAQEITIISSKLFHNVKESELLWWSIDQSNSHSYNLRRLTISFNFISFWTRTMILMNDEQKIREKVFAKFLKIGKYLKHFGDLNSYLAIIAALDCGPINRLPWNKTIKEEMKEHRLIMSSNYSFKNYRQLFSQCKPPCIPYIGLILQDLTFIYNGAIDTLPDKERNGLNYINFVKCFKQFTILESIRKLKMWDYSFESNEEYKNFLNNFVEHYSEEECWIRSEMIKPRGSKN